MLSDGFWLVLVRMVLSSCGCSENEDESFSAPPRSQPPPGCPDPNVVRAKRAAFHHPTRLRTPPKHRNSTPPRASDLRSLLSPFAAGCAHSRPRCPSAHNVRNKRPAYRLHQQPGTALGRRKEDKEQETCEYRLSPAASQGLATHPHAQDCPAALLCCRNHLCAHRWTADMGKCTGASAHG
ncbi:hypothetical protein JOL62DRAFT_252282 [Phyllosticta paracitricarpa]|uniref:Secreted protein n=1 Tax=Phyllosticta paracitricarpa TaxID=2016321 RepID=A0ABR1MXS9_9PEZI